MKRLVNNFLFMALVCVWACKSSQPAAPVTQEPENPKPYWVAKRPIDGEHYIGIAAVSKLQYRLDYAQQAKSRALEDLASEIKVKVESNSILYQLEKNNRFKDDFEQIIQNKTSEELQDFELVGSWENDQEYWVYYRLSRAKHQALEEEKKTNAKNLSFDAYKRAVTSEKEGNIVSALEQYLTAMEYLQNYLGETVTVQYEGKSIILGSEIYARIRGILDNTKLMTRSGIDYTRGLTGNVAINVTLQHKNDALAYQKISTRFSSGKGKVSKNSQTNASGKTEIDLQSVSSDQPRQQLSLFWDLEPFANKSTFAAAFLKGFEPPKAIVDLNVRNPKVYLTSTEKMFGKTRSVSQLKEHFTQVITNKGFEVSGSRTAADLVCDIVADTKKGNSSSGITSAYLNGTVTLSNAKTNKNIYIAKLENIKGVQLDLEQAGVDAYKKAYKTLERKIIREMQRTVFE